MSASPQTIARLAFLCLMLALSSPLFAEGSHEIGVLGGFTSYRSVNVSNPERSGKAGAKEGPAAGFVLGQSMGNHWGGEFRYLYFRNDLQLEGGSASADFKAESHAVHYDVLYYANGQEARVRPYAAIGVGLKIYRGTGTEQAFQPLSDLALLTKSSQTVIAGDVGGGVKVRVGSSGMFRVEFRGYVTPVPDKIIADSIDSKISGLLWHWAPLFGFSWTF